MKSVQTIDVWQVFLGVGDYQGENKNVRQALF
jgi:hypothetical protein